MLSVSFHAAIEQEHDHEQEQEERGRLSSHKNYRPPHPIGVKGGCSPQNNCRKLSTVVSEVLPAGNKIFHKFFTKFSAVLGLGIGINKGWHSGQRVAQARVAVSSFTCVIWATSGSRAALRVRCWSRIPICWIRIFGAPCFSFPSTTRRRAR